MNTWEDCESCWHYQEPVDWPCGSDPAICGLTGDKLGFPEDTDFPCQIENCAWEADDNIGLTNERT